jgi:D-3-phosphoglycerate dehydrogenase
LLTAEGRGVLRGVLPMRVGVGMGVFILVFLHGMQERVFPFDNVAGGMGKVLIAAPVHQALCDGLIALGYELVVRDRISQAGAFEWIKDCVGVVTSTRLLLDQALLDAAPLLKWIGRMGSGMEVIDLDYAARKGIWCFSSPEGNCNAVGEHALGMLLSLTRRIVWSHNELREGTWLREENRGYELEGKTVGIIGYGHTGASFAKKLMGFDVNILAYDKYNPERIPAHFTKCNDLSPIFESADIVSFHVPLQDDTVHYLDMGFVARMRKPFIVVNTSRGPVVDFIALHQGLVSGKITGACLDVFEKEPLQAMDGEMVSLMKGLLARPDFIATPHIAGYTHEALYKMSMALLHKLS